EIQNFKSEEYWKITAMLAPAGTVAKPKKTKSKPKSRKKAAPEDDGEGKGAANPPAVEVPEGAVLAELTEWAGQKFKATNEQEASTIVTALEGASYVVGKVEQKERQEK